MCYNAKRGENMKLAIDAMSGDLGSSIVVEACQSFLNKNKTDELYVVGKIEELEAANLPNNLPDVDVAVINGNYALEHNLGDSANVLLTESFTDEEAQPYINYLVVKEGNENTAKTKALKKALQSKKVKNYIKKYKGSVKDVFTDPTK